MRTIIVASDFSPISNNAVQYAIDAAKHIDARVILFHLYRISSHVANSLVGTKSIDDMLMRKKKEVEQISMQLSTEHNLNVVADVRMGEFLVTIEQVMEDYSGRFLVVGMPKKSLEHYLLGNTTTSAIQTLKFPILAVPEQVKYHGIKRILYACDIKRGVHLQVVKNIKEFAESHHAEVNIFYVGDHMRSDVYDAAIEEGLEGIKYSFKNVPAQSVISAILKEANEIEADLIVMSPHKYGFWSSIIHTSKTNAMASNGKIPLLSIGY